MSLLAGLKISPIYARTTVFLDNSATALLSDPFKEHLFHPQSVIAERLQVFHNDNRILVGQVIAAVP